MNENEILKLTTEWVDLGDNPRGGTARVRGIKVEVFDGSAYESIYLTPQEAITLGKMAEAWLAENDKENN